jgi:archaellum component FlaC
MDIRVWGNEGDTWPDRRVSIVEDNQCVFISCRYADIDKSRERAEQIKTDLDSVAQITAERDTLKEDFDTCYKELEGERKRADGFEAEVDGSHDSIIRQDEILTGVANALKGQPDDLMAHSHHDLAEVAQRVVGERNALIEYMKDIHVTCDNTSGNFDKVLEAVSGLTTEALANIDKEESK